jgi:hypothetical protein
MSGKRLIAALFLLMALGGTSWSEDKKPSKADEEAEKLKGLRAKIKEQAKLVEEQAKIVKAHYEKQFRRLYNYELSFMRIATDLNKQQFERIAAECEPVMMEAMVTYLKTRKPDQRPADPNLILIDGIAKAVHKHLSPEQAARYKKELDNRTAANKRMALANLVVKVDKTLILTADQRGKLTLVLENNWDDSWTQAHQYMHDSPEFPAMPDEKILPILTERQQTFWKSIPKRKLPSWSFGRGDLEEEVWPEDASNKVEVPAPKEQPPANGGAKP